VVSDALKYVNGKAEKLVEGAKDLSTKKRKRKRIIKLL
jgi:hypothetical protein